MDREVAGAGQAAPSEVDVQAIVEAYEASQEELAQLSDDLQNLLAATDIATLFLDRELRILRFTPRVGELFNVRPADRGRPLADLTSHLGYPELTDDASRVLQRLAPVEREVADEAGRWYLTRVLPYRSSSDEVAGVVLTFVDITERKRAEDEVREARTYAESIVETLHEPLLVLSSDLRVESVNQAFYDHFEVDPAETIGRLVYDLGNGQWNIPELRVLLEDVLPENNVFNDFEVAHDFEDLGERVMLVNARRLDHVQLILLGIRDVTERKRAEETLRESEEQYRTLFESIDEAFILSELVRGDEGQVVDMRILEVNPAWEAHTGIAAGEVVGRTAREVFPETGATFLPRYVRVVETGEPERFEAYHPSLDRWLEVYAFPSEGDRFGSLFTDITERKHASEAIRESEERFRTLFDESQDVILLADDEGRLVDANPAAFEVLGYERNELLAKGIGDISDVDERAFRTVWQAFLEQGEMQGEYQLRTRSGERVDMEFSAVANVLPGQHLSTLRDITERKRIVEALRQSEERLRVALGAVKMGVWRFDVETGAATRSERFYEIYGYEPPPGGAHLDDFYERVHPDDLDRVRAAVEAGYRGERPYSETFRIVRLDGTTRWVHSEGRLVHDERDGSTTMTGVVQDITERREAEEALRQSEERYRLLVESATEYAMLMLDPENQIVAWSRGAERIFGYTDEEIIGRSGALLFIEEDRAAGVPEQELMSAVRTDQAADDRWHVRKSGERFWANGVMTALRYPDGRLRGFAKVLRDNTERKQAEDELRWLNETLEARVRERTEQVRELASTLAMAEQDERRRIAQILHDDLQQLLFGIQLKMTFVHQGAEKADAPELAEHTAESERLLDRAIQVTRQLTVDLSPPVLAGEGLTHALEWLTTQMEEVHNLQVEVLSGQPFAIPHEGMRVLLFQIVRELLFNVVKHADTDRALVTLDEDGGSLIITVEDEGSGFDPAALQPKAQGGFGLFSVRERLRLFGGHLEIDSAPGQGTRMTATLPALLVPTSDD